MKSVSLCVFAAVAVSLCSLPASAGNILFSDLAPGSSPYDTTFAWAVSGSASCCSSGYSFTSADLFTVAGSGNEAVGEIDLAVGTGTAVLNTFYVSIRTDDAGTPGSQVAGAYWSGSTTNYYSACCSLFAITDISGVTLTGGQQYFLVLGPVGVTDNSFISWYENTQGVTGDEQYSNDGGATWSDNGVRTLGAFDVRGVPEPGSILLLGTGFAGILLFGQRKVRGNL